MIFTKEVLEIYKIIADKSWKVWSYVEIEDDSWENYFCENKRLQEWEDWKVWFIYDWEFFKEWEMDDKYLSIIGSPVMIWDVLNYLEQTSQYNPTVQKYLYDWPCTICWIWFKLHKMLKERDCKDLCISSQNQDTIDYVYNIILTVNEMTKWNLLS